MKETTLAGSSEFSDTNDQAGAVSRDEETREDIANVLRMSGLHPAHAEPLTPYNEEFLYPSVGEGEDVYVGYNGKDGHQYLQCDYSSFESELGGITPQKLEQLFIEAKMFQEQAPGLDEGTRRMLHTCWRASRIAKKVLGDPTQESIRTESFGAYKIEGTMYSRKPLSRSKGEAMCSEYALFVHHVLRKLGIDSSVVVGAFAQKPDSQFADRHTFLSLENGKWVFDPTHTLQQKDCWPVQVFSPEETFDAEHVRNMAESGAFGRKMQCTNLLTKQVRIYGSGAT